MAGNGYRPEGHEWRAYFGTLGCWICIHCAEVVDDRSKASDECIDDC